MLKKIVNSLDDVEEKFHSLYEQKADGKYHLKVEDDDAEELRRAKQHEVEARKEAERKAKEFQDQMKTLQDDLKKLRDEKDDDHRDKGDVEALDKSWQEKYTTREQELNGRIEKLNAALQGQMVDNVAQGIATKLAGDNAEILRPHLNSRLSVEIDENGQAKTIVKDGGGKRSALTVEDLEKEFFTSEKFAPIIVGSKAKGSGATGAERGGNHGRKFSEMSSAEKVNLKRKNPQEYRRLRDAEDKKES